MAIIKYKPENQDYTIWQLYMLASRNFIVGRIQVRTPEIAMQCLGNERLQEIIDLLDPDMSDEQGTEQIQTLRLEAFSIIDAYITPFTNKDGASSGAA